MSTRYASAIGSSPTGTRCCCFRNAEGRVAAGGGGCKRIQFSFALAPDAAVRPFFEEFRMFPKSRAARARRALIAAACAALLLAACGSEQARSEEHTSELQSLMPTSYAVFCLKKQ